MTTSERISWRSPELWFGIFAGIAIPTLLARFTALLLSNFPGEPGEVLRLLTRSMFVLIVAAQVALAITGFALRKRHRWAVGLLAGSLLLLLPGGTQPLLGIFGDSAAPFNARVAYWSAGAFPGMVLLVAAASVIQRVRFGDHVALALSLGFSLYALELALVA